MSRSLRITFVLPKAGNIPVGGLRVVYEYANHLSRRGHVISVVHPARLSKSPKRSDFIRNAVRYAQRIIDGSYRPDKWFHMDPEVRLLCVPTLSERFVPDGDVVVASAWETAEWVENYSERKGERFYLIQHLETWNGPKDRVYSTWKAPLQKIVISKWLLNIALDFGEEAEYIPNGLDTAAFHIRIPPEDRNPKHLMMMYHLADWKGSQDAIDAVVILREREPDISVTIFGVPERPKGLPDWITYHRNPEQQILQKLYNEAAIFIGSSWTEGWGLTCCEAMLSGASLVATDIDGYREFAFDGITALLSPPKDPAGLAKNAERLINDPALRISLAREGHRYASQFTWKRATDSIENLFLENVGERGGL